MRGVKLVLFISLFGVNCQECKPVCCELADGAHDRRSLGRCLDDGGVEQEDVECDNIGDPDGDPIDTDVPEETDEDTDVPADTDETDVPVDTDLPDTDPPAAPTCADFCAGILVVCPADLSCEQSCEDYATLSVTVEAVDCAAGAATCQATGACWDLLGL
jgi:hypothetical protein